MTLPLPWTTSSPIGSAWIQGFTFPDTDLSTMTFELVLRTSSKQSGTPAARISSTAATASGYIAVDPVQGTVLAVLSPTATTALAAGQVYALALWSDVGLTTQLTWANGLFTALPVAAP